MRTEQKNNPDYTGAAVVLRRWQMRDAPALAKMIANPKITANLRDGLPDPYTVADAQDYIAGALAADPDKTFAWAIEVDGKLAGSIGIFRQENIHRRTAELGYYLAEPLWGQGIMSGAVRQACRIVLDTTDILRIFAEPFAGNLASCRVLEKAGFTYEGTLRANAVKDGVVQDMKMYAMVRTNLPLDGRLG